MLEHSGRARSHAAPSRNGARESARHGSMVYATRHDASPSEAERRFGLAAGTYPFQSRFETVQGARLHYVDEGRGPVLFMLHGNPTWSYLYRHLLKALRGELRCIAMDLAGFGLSEAPAGFGYTPPEHAAVVARFLERLDLRDATLIAHDWGGPIGLDAMFATSGRITRLCLGNTWAWPVNGQLHFEWFSTLMGGPLGRFGTHRFATFINVVMPSAMRRRKLTGEEMTAYRAPFAGGKPRTPMHVFPRHITASGPWLHELSQKVASFEGPAHFIWPDRDIAFRMKELQRWKTLLPQASTTLLASCGHFLWEDAPDECIEAIRSFMEGGRGRTSISC